MYAYYIISMTTMCFYDDCILFEKAAIFFTLLLHSSNLLTVAHMEVKLGTRRFHDDHNIKQPQALFFLHSSNLLPVAHIQVKLAAHVYYIVSMTTPSANSLRQFSQKLLVHFSNLLKVAHMEIKLGTHACYINDNFFSMTTTLFEQHQIASSTLHSSNLLMVYSTHGDETWYECV